MNLYSKKQRWKLLLVGIAAVIVLSSLWYTNILVRQIAQEEREKVRLWAGAIQNKANLVQLTGNLFNKISEEERNRIEIWAEATKRIVTSNDQDATNFYLQIIGQNETIPVIVTDENGKIINYRNINLQSGVDTTAFLQAQLDKMKTTHDPIDIKIHVTRNITWNHQLYYQDSEIFTELKLVLDDIIKSFISEIVVNSASVPVVFTDSSQTKVIEYGNLDKDKIKDSAFLANTISEMRNQNPPIAISINKNETQYIFYKDSELLTQLKYYPFFQFGVIGLFILIAYYMFSTSRKSEQNQVWVGLAKETAHQLGTPLSSLMAWVEYLKLKNVDQATIDELSKDVQRLEVITERFSKIGSLPKLSEENIGEVLRNTVAYLQPRISKNVAINFRFDLTDKILAPLNTSLFSWVIENLIKNAVDAMQGEGKIDVSIIDQKQFVYIDISDTGHGIPKSKQKTIFEPGFTTKKRGWGLGLSLTKRIIENYHDGKIFVKQSNEKGTVFRIVLKKY